MVRTFGTDVSNWNRPPLPQLSTSFVFAKATEGLRFNDPSYKTWRAIARKQGKTFGAYHFGRPDRGNDPIAEAAHFLAFAKLGIGDLAILDIEVVGGNTGVWVERFCSYVNTHALCDIVVYTNGNVGSRLENSGHRPLWIADPSHPMGYPAVPYPFRLWAIHQFGITNGFDRNVTNDLSGQALKQFGVKTPNSAKHPNIVADNPARRDAIAARNALMRLFYVLHIPWTAKA